MSTQMLIEKMDAHFSACAEYFDAFADEGVQIEGWFKGEMLVLLRRLKKEGLITGFHREQAIGAGGRKRLDFVIDFGGERVAIELKAWLDGFQKGTRWCAHHYCTADTVTGIGPDLAKLEGSGFEGKLVLVFCYRNPGVDGWRAALARLSESLPMYSLRSVTKPEDYPPQHFMAVLELVAEAAAV